MLLAWGPGYTEEKLLTELRRLRPHGTSVLVYNLWENEHGDKELDLFSDLSDVRTRPATEVDGVAGGEEAGCPCGERPCSVWRQGRAAGGGSPKVLWVPALAAPVRSHALPPASCRLHHDAARPHVVEPRIITKDLKHLRVERYTPTVQPASGLRWRSVGSVRPASGSEIVNSALAEALTRKVEFTRAELERVGLRGAGGGGGGGGGGGELRLSSFIAVGDSYFQPAEAGRTYKIHIGFAREAPNVDAQGFNLYHNNRLIKPMWEVYKSPSSVGRGVVGVVEVDFVQPSHDKQDFERTDAMNRLESKLKLLVPAYWKANGRRVGYQSADPLPRELKEHAAEQIRAADASDASGDDDDDAPPAHLAHSRLFGSDREGGRKRKLPMHMESYRIYHSVARKDHPATRKEPPAASGLPRAAANGGGSGGGGSGGGGASGNAAAAAAREGGCGESSAEGQRLLGGAARIDSSEVVVVEAVRVVGEEGEGSAFGEDPPRSTMLVAEATAVGERRTLLATQTTTRSSGSTPSRTARMRATARARRGRR